MRPAGKHILSPNILNNMRQHLNTPGNHLRGLTSAARIVTMGPSSGVWGFFFSLSFRPNFARVTHQIFKMLNGIRGEKEARVKKGQREGGAGGA